MPPEMTRREFGQTMTSAALTVAPALAQAAPQGAPTRVEPSELCYLSAV